MNTAPLPVQIINKAENMIEYSPFTCSDHQQGGEYDWIPSVYLFRLLKRWEDDRKPSFYLFISSTRRRIWFTCSDHQQRRGEDDRTQPFYLFRSSCHCQQGGEDDRTQFIYLFRSPTRQRIWYNTIPLPVQITIKAEIMSEITREQWKVYNCEQIYS